MINPSSKSVSQAALTLEYHKVDSLVGGTAAMRAAGQQYLPKHPEELDANYEKRLKTSTLVNFYSKALDAAVGRVFKTDPAVANLPAALQPLLEDMDGTGSPLNLFGQEVLWHGLHHGAAFVVTDFPTLDVVPQTLAEQNALAARPYAVLVSAPQVLAAYSSFENGVERLCHFRWTFTRIAPAIDGLSENIIETVKAYDQPTAADPITLRTWERSTNSVWAEKDPIVIQGPIDIPVAVLYGWKAGFCLGRPVLRDLADLNIAHWQSLSEQTHILSVARVPFLHVAGNNLTTVTPQADGSTAVTPFKLSIHSAAITPGDTKIEWVETKGAAISAGENNLAYLERKMQELSLVPITSQTGDMTATATAINASESNVILSSITRMLEDVLSRTLYHMSVFAGSPAPTVSVSLKSSFNVEHPTPQQMQKDAASDAEAQITDGAPVAEQLPN